MINLASVWEQAQPQIKDKVGEASYETWFSTIKVSDNGNQTLTIETPDEFFKNWVVDHYQALVENILTELGRQPVKLEFKVNTNILTEQIHQKPEPFEEKFQNSETAKARLNPRYTFDNFVIGSSNRFACAAGQAVAESPAKAYNPLFIYGHVGLGKTHLIQAITHTIRQLHPSLKHCYLTSEKFTNELIDAIRHRSTSEFRRKYRDIDVLLIDDIHFIAGKESTQEEFFHTFNYLHNNRKQIIITSDRPPKEIANLEERLSSRFAWGLITDIQPPDFETRVAILRKKVEHESTRVPDDVIYFIAKQIQTNIRELEGALIRVVAYSLLEEKPITLDMTERILKDMVSSSKKIVSVEMVQRLVAEHFKIPLQDLFAKRRNKHIVFARQVAMYLSRQLTNMSLPEIGGAFGGKDHTTVLHSYKKIEEQVSQNEETKLIINRLTASLTRN